MVRTRSGKRASPPPPPSPPLSTDDGGGGERGELATASAEQAAHGPKTQEQATHDVLYGIYSDVTHPASFSSAWKLYRAAKPRLPWLKQRDVEAWLETQPSYTLHRKYDPHFSRRKVLARGRGYQYQADLVDYAPLKRENHGYRFLLTVIDVFSRLAVAIPVKDKRGETVAAALRTAFDTMGDPVKLQTDHGTEFYNSHVRSVLAARDVEHFSTFQEVKVQIVECFNRTLRDIVKKSQTDRGSLNYVDHLPAILEGYNSRPHSSIYPFAPNEVNSRNERAVFDLQYGDYLRRRGSRHKYKMGDVVRVSSARSTFRKSYGDSNFTKHLFEVVDLLYPGEKPMYRLKDLRNGDIVRGTYYEHQLQRVRRPYYEDRPPKKVPRRIGGP